MLPAPKVFASLSSGLLARKGQARPAMRRQMTLLESGAQPGEDLGWNDMGEPLPVAGDAVNVPLPPVLTQREELAHTLDAVVEAAAEPIGAPMPTTTTGAGTRRAAFTLRLDAARHLRLRLASATRRVSAQRLVTQALDDFLKTMPELDPLAAGANTDRLGD